MDPEKYCLKSANLKTVLLNDEKVSDFVATFKKSMKEYKVKLVEMTPADRRKAEEKRGRRPRSRQHAPRSSEPGARTNPGHSGPTPGTSRGGPEDSGFRQRFYPEFNVGMDHDGQEANQGMPNGADDADFNDAASQDSQDPQNEFVDIKTAAITRMNATPNSVFHTVRQEIQHLKRMPNYMKISRYIPHSINLLSHMLPGSP
jgi:hypothetical protein